MLDRAFQDAITRSLSTGNFPPVKRLGAGPAALGISARIAQLVEQRIENPRVGGSNPPPGTIFSPHY
jgi:hypothetical protein